MLLDFVLHINHRALILLWAVIVAFIFMSYRVHYLFLILGRCIFLYYRILSCIWNSLNQKCFLRNKKMRWRGMKLGVFMGLCRLTFSSRSSSTWITIDMACIDTNMTKIFSVQPVYAYMIDWKLFCWGLQNSPDGRVIEKAWLCFQVWYHWISFFFICIHTYAGRHLHLFVGWVTYSGIQRF